MSAIKRGALIVIEGVDRSGKSTQCRNLVANLNERNIPSQLMSFPDRTTPIGKLINEYLSNSSCTLHDKVIHLLFSANRWENCETMKKLLYNGVTLVIDRYSYSGIAFSTIKKNMDIDWCKQPENGLPKPDRVFLLTLDEEDMIKRPGFGNERYENVEFQQKVAELYTKLSTEDDNWDVINAQGSIDEVQNILLEKTLPIVNKTEMPPLQELDFNKKKKPNKPVSNHYHTTV